MDREESETLFAALLDPKKIGAHCRNGTGYQRMARQRRAFYVVAASTGLRWREVARLTWGNVDLVGQVVTAAAGQTKNGQQAELPLVGEVVDALREIRPDDAESTDRVFSAEPRLKTWRADLRRAGLIGSKDDKDAGYVDARGRRLDRKCLRMSFCTWLKRGGVDLRDAQRLMRHSDPRLTSNVYSDLRVADLRAAVEKGLAGPAKAAAPAAEAKTA
jgi:integrase